MSDDSNRSTVADNAEVTFPRLTSEDVPFPPEGRALSQKKLHATSGGEAGRRPGSWMGSILRERKTGPADVGRESASEGTSPYRTGVDWGLTIALIAVLLLMALSTAYVLNDYISERLMAAMQQQGLDNASERFRMTLNSAASLS